MIRGIRGMIGFTIRAVDGDIGKVEDFFFDDETWTVRYLVDKTGGWLGGKQFLVSPSGFDGAPDWERRIFPLALTREKVRRSPDIDAHEPVSRQKEQELLSYYGSPAYWQYYSSQTMPPVPSTPPIPEQAFETMAGGAKTAAQGQEPHLRSAVEVIGYALQEKDARAGTLRDLLADDASWEIRYLEADMNTWLPGGNVLVPKGLIDGVSWEERQIRVRCSRDHLREAPAYDGSPFGREYEERLARHYGIPLR